MHRSRLRFRSFRVAPDEIPGPGTRQLNQSVSCVGVNNGLCATKPLVFCLRTRFSTFTLFMSRARLFLFQSRSAFVLDVLDRLLASGRINCPLFLFGYTRNASCVWTRATGCFTMSFYQKNIIFKKIIISSCRFKWNTIHYFWSRCRSAWHMFRFFFRLP